MSTHELGLIPWSTFSKKCWHVDMSTRELGLTPWSIYSKKCWHVDMSTHELGLTPWSIYSKKCWHVDMSTHELGLTPWSTYAWWSRLTHWRVQQQRRGPVMYYTAGSYLIRVEKIGFALVSRVLGESLQSEKRHRAFWAAAGVNCPQDVCI